MISYPHQKDVRIKDRVHLGPWDELYRTIVAFASAIFAVYPWVIDCLNRISSEYRPNEY